MTRLGLGADAALTADAAAPVADGPASGAHPVAQVLAPGVIVGGRYVVGEPLGIGGQGAVYRATHATLDLPVALKVLSVGKLSPTQQEQLGERFTREARTIAGIRHRNVLSVHDAGLLADGSPYLVTELIDGEDLEQRIARAPLSIAAVVDLGRQLFSALTAIAEGGVLHRDVKPANVMLHRESDAQVHVKLIDFGIAHDAADKTRLTVTGQILGTPHYMAPEQLRGEELDLRVDVYAASAVLYEALTGDAPFDAVSAPLVMGKILGGELPPVRSLRPECPVELAMLIERGLSRAREARPAHPLVVVNELGVIAQRLGLPTGPLAWAEDDSHDGVLPLLVRVAPTTPPSGEPNPEGATLTPPPEAAVERPLAPAPRRPRAKTLLAVGLGMGALGVAMSLWLGLRDPSPSPSVAAIAVSTPPNDPEPVAVTAIVPPIDIAPLLRHGLESLARGETDAALASYRAACAADANSPEAQRGRGLAASRAGMNDEAIAAFERYLAVAPDAADATRVRDRLRGLRARRRAAPRQRAAD